MGETQGALYWYWVTNSSYKFDILTGEQSECSEWSSDLIILYSIYVTLCSFLKGFRTYDIIHAKGKITILWIL